MENANPAETAEQIIKSTRGKFFRVEFIKKNGERRVMNARLGVRKNLTGTGLAFEPREHNLVVVYDVTKHSYRMVRLDTVLSVQSGAINYRRAE